MDKVQKSSKVIVIFHRQNLLELIKVTRCSDLLYLFQIVNTYVGTETHAEVIS
jgi:hypothetical protein